MDRARAAQRDAAAVFCPGEPQLVPQIPEQRHRRITVEGLLLAVDAQLDHGVPPVGAVGRNSISDGAPSAISLINWNKLADAVYLTPGASSFCTQQWPT